MITPSAPPDDDTEIDDDSEMQTEGSQDPSSFMVELKDYPLYKETSHLLEAAGYREDDPLHLFLQITANYERNLRMLSNRYVQLHAANAELMQNLQGEVANVASAIDELNDRLDTIQPLTTQIHTQSELLTKSLSESVPFMARTQQGMQKTVELLEHKSSKAILLLFSAGALVFCAGFVVALAFR